MEAKEATPSLPRKLVECEIRECGIRAVEYGLRNAGMRNTSPVHSIFELIMLMIRGTEYSSTVHTYRALNRKPDTAFFVCAGASASNSDKMLIQYPTMPEYSN